VVTPYEAVNGAWEPVIPAQGWCGSAGSGCVLVLDHRRPRKTGPGFPLWVMRCTAHKVAFTLYPPGHVPYGRQALAPVSPAGGAVSAGALTSVEEVWSGTYFTGAIDAAGQKTWSRGVDGGVEQWWGGAETWRSTQGEHIAVAMALTGIAPWQTQRDREQVGRALGVPLMLLMDAAAMVGQGAGCHRRGQAVVTVLRQVDLLGAWDRLAVCAQLCGWRGGAHRWDGRQLRSLPFRSMGTGAPARGG